MHEQLWQAVVGPALVAELKIDPEYLHHEVQTLDGSIADLVVCLKSRIIVFELKMAELGELVNGLGARGLRQLRHFQEAADEVYVVTVASPRSFEWVEGRVVIREPLEAQLLPEGVGWYVFDAVGLSLTMMRPATPSKPKPAARTHLTDKILYRLSAATRAAQWCRNGV